MGGPMGGDWKGKVRLASLKEQEKELCFCVFFFCFLFHVSRRRND